MTTITNKDYLIEEEAEKIISFDPNKKYTKVQLVNYLREYQIGDPIPSSQQINHLVKMMMIQYEKVSRFIIAENQWFYDILENGLYNIIACVLNNAINDMLNAENQLLRELLAKSKKNNSEVSFLINLDLILSCIEFRGYRNVEDVRRMLQ